MKNMKLIMENFRKTMKEGWPGTEEPKAPWTGKPQKNWDKEIEAKTAAEQVRAKAEMEVIELIKDKYGKNAEDLYNEPHPMRALVAYIEEKFEQITKQQADEQNILDILNKLEVLNPKIGTPGSLQALFAGEDEEMPSDTEEPPGFMPGEGGNY